jgi:hypothetical protein
MSKKNVWFDQNEQWIILGFLARILKNIIEILEIKIIL